MVKDFLMCYLRNGLDCLIRREKSEKRSLVELKEYHGGIRIIIAFLILLNTFNLIVAHVANCSEPIEKQSIKENLRTLKGKKLFVNKRIYSESKHFTTRYNSNFRGIYRPAEFKNTYDSDLHRVGDVVLDLAIIYWIDNDRFTKDYLINWCEQAVNIENWGDNHDIDISHLLFALSIVYDWHRDKFDKEFQVRLKTFIYDHAKYQFEHAVKNQNCWWGSSYWQNHCWINYTSILASGMALSDDYEEALAWIAVAKNKIEKVLMVFATDGSNHEGLNYSVYGNIWLVRALTLLETFDKDIFNKSDYLRNYYKYYTAFSVDSKLTKFFDISDSPQCLLCNPCEIFLKLYHVYKLDEYRDLYLFYLDKYKNLKPGLFSTVYGLLENAKLKDAGTSKEPYFSEDLGIFIDKRIEKGEVVVSLLFKSGIPGGKTAHCISNAKPTYQTNAGHEHPDQNHFIVWNKNGFLVSDTGYTNKKLTIDHNSLLINDIGQLGEGEMWFNDSAVNKKAFSEKAGLRKEGIYSSEDVSIVNADAAAFYPDRVGLRKFERTLVWVKPLGFIVFDTIETAKPEALKLIFHSNLSINNSNRGEFSFKGKVSTVGKLISLYPRESNIAVSRHDIVSHPKGKEQTVGEKISIDKKMQDTHEDFLTLIFPDNKKEAYTYVEEKDHYQVGVHDDKESFTALFKKRDNDTIVFGDYAINAKLVTISFDKHGHSKKMIVFQGKSISRAGGMIWEVDAEQNRDFLFDGNGKIIMHD